MRTALICAGFLALAVLSIQAKPQEQEVGRARAAREAAPVPDPRRRKLQRKQKKKQNVQKKNKPKARSQKPGGRSQGRAIVVKGNNCEYITLADIPSNTGCTNGNKFVLKGNTGVRKQFLIMTDKALLAFVTKGAKFTACTAFTDITTDVKCKEVTGLSSVDLSATASATTAADSATTAADSGNQAAFLNKRVNLTHAAHGAYGYAELNSDTTVRLTELYYDGAGPMTNWIVGTDKNNIAVTTGTVIIDELTSTGAPLYPNASDFSGTVLSLPAFDNSSALLTLPIIDGTQMTWSEVSWLALYCRKVKMLFMSVTIPDSFN